MIIEDKVEHDLSVVFQLLILSGEDHTYFQAGDIIERDMDFIPL